MKQITKKTEKEKLSEITITPFLIDPNITPYYDYWSCESCNVAFFRGDTILKTSDYHYKCPLKVKRGFLGKKVVCMNNVYGGNKESFDRYYKILTK